MYKVNIARVLGKMGEKQITRCTLSQGLNISRNTLNVYLHNPNKMPYGTIAKMASILCDTAKEAQDIFFSQ